jgi:hypothetical protein
VPGSVGSDKKVFIQKLFSLTELVDSEDVSLVGDQDLKKDKISLAEDRCPPPPAPPENPPQLF